MDGARNQIWYGFHNVKDDRLTDALNQIQSNMYCESETGDHINHTIQSSDDYCQVTQDFSSSMNVRGGHESE